MLCCELDVAHRYLEGKYEALKILQGKVCTDVLHFTTHCSVGQSQSLEHPDSR